MDFDSAAAKAARLNAAAIDGLRTRYYAPGSEQVAAGEFVTADDAFNLCISGKATELKPAAEFCVLMAQQMTSCQLCYGAREVQIANKLDLVTLTFRSARKNRPVTSLEETVEYCARELMSGVTERERIVAGMSSCFLCACMRHRDIRVR
jgi:hypothetical protein